MLSLLSHQNLTSMTDFINYYETLKNDFNRIDKLKSLMGGDKPFDWPAGAGVYVIWKEEELLYVGMTGKFKRTNDEIVLNQGSFEKRSYRWTPYQFCDSPKNESMQYHFRFGPRYSNVKKQAGIRYERDAYVHSVGYKSLKIDCFIVDSNHPKYSPTLLEAEILTKYLKTTGDLPPANNAL